MKTKILYVAILIFFSGCIELLELAAEDVAGLGVEIDGLGELAIVDEGMFNSSWESVTLSEESELFVKQNGKTVNFGELIEKNVIKLNDGRAITLPGNVYRVGTEQAYIRYNPYLDINDQNIIGTYEKGRLVIVSGESFGWYEVQLPDHLVGYILASSLVPGAPAKDHQKDESRVPLKKAGWRNGINYVLDGALNNSPTSKEMIINFVNEDGTFDNTSSEFIANEFNQKGYACNHSFFSKDYYIDGIYECFFADYSGHIKKLDLFRKADFLLICVYTISYHTNEIKREMITSELDFKVKKIDLQSGRAEKSIFYKISGNGWSSRDAKRDALFSLYTIIQKNIQ